MIGFKEAMRVQRRGYVYFWAWLEPSMRCALASGAQLKGVLSNQILQSIF